MVFGPESRWDSAAIRGLDHIKTLLDLVKDLPDEKVNLHVHCDVAPQVKVDLIEVLVFEQFVVFGSLIEDYSQAPECPVNLLYQKLFQIEIRQVIPSVIFQLTEQLVHFTPVGITPFFGLLALFDFLSIL